MKKIVLTFKELCELIPETLEIKEKKYTNMKSFLTICISTIEKSGEWEFVQYAATDTDAVFIIKNISATKDEKVTPKAEISKETSSPYNNLKDNLFKDKDLPW